MVAEIFGVDGIIVIVAVVIVLLFGGSKLPKLARSLGSASHEFKKGVQAGDRDASLPLGSTSTDAAAVTSSEHLDV
ncbi:MAG TPA: twin-arginine translocase TatA/TatE family subunit [Acidimicrobiales bacterium]